MAKQRPLYIVHADHVELVISPDQVLREEEVAEDIARKLMRDGFIHGWLRDDYQADGEKAVRSALFAHTLLTITVTLYGDV